MSQPTPDASRAQPIRMSDIRFGMRLRNTFHPEYGLCVVTRVDVDRGDGVKGFEFAAQFPPNGDAAIRLAVHYGAGGVSCFELGEAEAVSPKTKMQDTPALGGEPHADPTKEKAMNPLEQLRGEPMVICERCQMKVPERLATFGIGVRGGDAAWCAACKTPEDTDGQAKRAEVIELRKAHLLRGQPGVTRIAEGVSHPVLPVALEADALAPPPEPAGWQPIASGDKEAPVLLFAPYLVHEDFNPTGCIEGFWNYGEGYWEGAVWCDEHDHWEAHEVKPTHWMPKPLPPGAARRQPDEPEQEPK